MLGDAHCHVSTGFDKTGIDKLIQTYSTSSLRLVVMSTNHIDYEIVDKLARGCPKTVVPSFGVHPWYSHLFTLDGEKDKSRHYEHVFGTEVDDEFLSVLPEPIDFFEHFKRLQNLISNYHAMGRAVCLGEVGLDRLFKIPASGFFGRAEPQKRGLTRYRTELTHQQRVLAAQLEYATRHSLPVSVHCVKSSGPLFEQLIRAAISGQTTNVCLHSYTGSIDSLRQLLSSRCPHRIYISLSAVINTSSRSTEDKLAALVAAIPPHRLLLETDMCIDTCDPSPLLHDIALQTKQTGTDSEHNLNEFLRQPEFA